MASEQKSLVNSSIILGILLGHAPTGEAQELMTKKYNEIYNQVLKDYETDQHRQFERIVVGMLYDGLKYGNWPWTVIK